MRGNRSRDTRPELALRRELHRRGLRYRVGVRIDGATIAVRPDVAFSRRRVAVFVDGCFWHCCPEHGTAPRTNADHWTTKLARNRRRDVVVNESLAAVGWTVLRFWEHEDPAISADVVEEAVRSGETST